MTRCKRLFAALVILILAFTIMPMGIFAASPGIDPSAAPYVQQGGDIDTFAYNMPFATYRIYPSYLRIGAVHMKSCEIKSPLLERKVDYYSVDSADLTAPAPKADVVYFTGDLSPGASGTIPGDAVIFTYEDAAIDIAGKPHDVRITVSDITVKNTDATRTAKSTAILVGAFWTQSTMFDEEVFPDGLTYGELRTHGMSNCYADMTIKIEILDTTYDGTVSISIKDLDVKDRQTNSYDGENSERIIMISEPQSKIYITGSPDNLLMISKDSDGFLFRGTAGDNSTFNSGFLTLSKTTSILRWRGGYCGTQISGAAYTLGIRPLYKAYNPDGTIDADYTIGANGGDISMSESYDNSDIVYSEQTAFSAVGKCAIRFYSNYKPVTVKMSPKEGYRLAEFNTATSALDTDFSGTSLLASVSNNEYSFTAANEDARFYSAFYEPITSSIKVIKKDQDGQPMQGVSFTASGTSSALGSFSISAETDANGEAVIEGIPYGTDKDAYTLTETVPSGYLPDGDNPITFFYKEDMQTFTVTNNKTYKVTYEIDPDPEYGTPADSVVPTDNNQYIKNDPVKVAPNLTTQDGTAVDPATGERVPGVWEFSLWDKDDFNITEDTLITGSWKFTPNSYEVEYVVNGDDKWGSPDGSSVPKDGNKYKYKDKVTVADDLTTAQGYAIDPETGEKVLGTWTFVSWDKDDFNITKNTLITGSWKFTPAPKPLPPDAPPTGDSTAYSFLMLALGCLGVLMLGGSLSKKAVKKTAEKK